MWFKSKEQPENSLLPPKKGFQVGDTVVVVRNADGDNLDGAVELFGRFGTIAEADDHGCPTVRFDDWSFGWDLQDNSKAGDCWMVHYKSLRRVSKIDKR